MNDSRPNPYPGPRSFQQGERLFGRQRETATLLDLLIAERVVLLYSPSGAGKTSLVQAALAPALAAEGFRVLPIMRPGLTPDQPAPGANRYVLSLLLGLEASRPEDEQTPLAELAGLTLASYLDRLPAPAEGVWHGDVLLFDQFEEILTANPTDRAAKLACFEQIGQALRDRNRWALFAMREEFVAALDPYLRPIPARFDKGRRYRLDLLSPDAARQAMQGPAEDAGVAFTDEAAIRLADDLRRTQVQQPDGSMAEALGPHIEPVQLQVVCRRLWDNLVPDDAVIDSDDLVAVGNVNTALRGYYADTVAAVTVKTGVRERALREWADRQLITEAGIRGQVLMGQGTSQGLPNAAIWPLVDAHLVRAEGRRGATWFELAHDRLIEPVRADNAEWAAAHLNAMQRQAKLWQEQGRSDGLLLSGDALVEAEGWATAHEAELEPHERVFLAACRRARERAERERRQSQQIRVLAVVAGTVAVLAVIALALTLWFATASKQNAAEARAAELRARLGELSAQSQLAVDTFPQRAALLAIESMRIAQSTDRSYPSAAEQGLRDALAGMGGLTLTGHHQWITKLAFSPDSRWLVTAGFDENAFLWDLESDRPTDDPMVLPEITASDGVEHVFFSNDMHWLITIVHDHIYLWDIQDGIPTSTSVELKTDIRYFPYSAAVSPNSRWLAVARSDPDGILLWDLMAADIPASRIELLDYRGDDPGIVFSQDSRWLMSRSEDGSVHLIDLNAPNLPDRSFTIPNSQGAFSEIPLSPDGSWLKTMSSDGIRLWNLRNEDPIRSPVEVELTAELRGLEFNSDGRMLAGATISGTVLLWPLDETGRISEPPTALEIPRNSVSSLSFSPDDRWLAGFDNEGAVQLWDLRPVDDSQPIQITLRHDGALESVVFSPDSQWMTVRDEHNFIHLWDLSLEVIDGVPVKLGGFDTDRIESLGFSQDSKWLVASSSGFIAPNFNDGTVRLWNLQQRDFHVEPTQLQAHPGPVTRAILDANERWLITGGEWPDTSVRVWDVELLGAISVPHILTELEGSTEVLAVDPTNRWLTTYGAFNSEAGEHLSATLRLWDMTLDDPFAQKPFSLNENPEYLTDAIFSDDGRWLVTLGMEPILWNLDDQEKPSRSMSLRRQGEPVWAAAFSHDGRWLITGSQDRTVRIWDLAAEDPNNASWVLGTGLNAITSIYVSPDNKRVVAGEGNLGGCPDCAALVWKLSASGQSDGAPQRLVGHTDQLHKVLITSDGGRVITSSSDGTARVWNLQPTGTITNSIVLRGHTEEIISIALSTNDRWLVTGSNDGTARVWDLSASDPNNRSIVLSGHERPVTAVMIKADNSTVITTGADGTVRSWSMGVEDLIERACSIVGRNLKREEWAQYFPGEAYRRTCDNLPSDPTADELLGPVGRALQLAEGGDIKNAVAGFDEALALNPEAEISADYWNALCWAGATWNQATLVLDACDAAVKLAPDSGSIRDSRGLARALAGDIQGAIEDFGFTLEIWKTKNASEELIASRAAWVEALRQGKDPVEVFDAATLEQLRNNK